MKSTSIANYESSLDIPEKLGKMEDQIITKTNTEEASNDIVSRVDFFLKFNVFILVICSIFNFNYCPWGFGTNAVFILSLVSSIAWQFERCMRKIVSNRYFNAKTDLKISVALKAIPFQQFTLIILGFPESLFHLNYSS